MSPSLGDKVSDPTRPGPKERETTHLHFYCRHPRATKSSLFALLVSPSQSDKRRKCSIQYVMGQRTSHDGFGVAIPSNKNEEVSIARCTDADCSRSPQWSSQAVGACIHSFRSNTSWAKGIGNCIAELLVCHPRHWNLKGTFSI